MAVTYEVLLLAIGFAFKVLGDVQSRWVKRAADTVDRWLLWRMSRFERQYRSYVVSRHRFVDLKGLATRGTYAPGLEEVFVDVTLGSRPAHEAQHEPLAGGVLSSEASKRQSIWDFLGGEQGICLAVIGAPGTGKTTLLKHAALRLSLVRRPGRSLPVILLLRDHVSAITAADEPAPTLPQVISSSLGRLQAQEPDGWFAQQLQVGRCVVLLDGLDEVAGEVERRAVSRWLEEQIEQYEDNDFVITSRPHGYLRAPLNRAQVLHVRRFTGEQISQFVHSWYRAVERLSTGTDDSGVVQQAADEAQDLLSRLRSRPALYELATNPLLLTMIAHVHRYRGALPGSRAGLYTEICEVLLWRRDQVKNPLGPDLDVTGAKKEVVLRELAYQMMKGRRRDADSARATRLIQPVLSRVASAASTETAEMFLGSMTANGLLVEREPGLFAFAHLTLQEHLAALRIRQHNLAGVLAAGVDDDWWRETTLLYAAHADPAPIVEACLVSRSTRALALAFDCADAAPELAPETARRLEDLRRAALQGPSRSPTRQLMTAVTATRLLSEGIRLGNDSILCARPISQEVYRLFASDTGRRVGPPLHGNSPEITAVGIPQQDVTPFLEWLNSVVRGATAYRVPTLAEAADPAFALVSRAPHHTVWCSAEDGGSLLDWQLWVPKTTVHPYVARLPNPSHWPDQQAEAVLTTGQLGVVYAFLRSLQSLLGTSLGGLLQASSDDVSALNSTLGRLLEAGEFPENEVIGVLEQTHKLADALTLSDVQEQARRQASRLPLDNALVLQNTSTLASVLLGGLTGNALARAVDAAVGDADKRLLNSVYVRACVNTLTRSRRSIRQAALRDPLPHTASRFLRACLTPEHEPTVILPLALASHLEQASVMMLRRLRALEAEGKEPQRLLLNLTKSTKALASSLPDICRFANPTDTAQLQIASITLAASAQQILKQPELADLYMKVAAGTNVLRERAASTISPSETLVLVRA
ncbi:NACHT domain-containing protein [Streptomyces sp. NPDC004237]|uniref:NACHT domain-containing protein n=1 Tax=Streptomyces sp. NPDC004237 TaxID=3154455 RepID=UPI0033ACE815